MSRYNSYSGSSTGGSNNNNNDYNDTNIKLKPNSTLRVTGHRVNAFDGTFGDLFVAGFEDAAVLDGVVLAREDKPDTWKVFGFSKLKNISVNEDGVPVDSDGEELSAKEILESPYVQGYSETHSGDDYYYEPVGVVIEQADDVATNGADTTDDGAIEIGEVSMLLNNKSWARKLAKLLTQQGEDYIRTTTDESGNVVPVTDGREWFTSYNPDLRDGIEGREIELFVIRETFTPNGEDEEITYYAPILLDAATGERITLDNGSSSDTAVQEPEPVAADGGATAADTESSETDTESPETTESPSTDDETDASGDAGGHVPDELDDLLDYFARTDGEDTSADDLREMAEDEVDVDEVDWDAAVAEVHSRA
jgi:hypothetical protein